MGFFSDMTSDAFKEADSSDVLTEVRPVMAEAVEPLKNAPIAQEEETFKDEKTDTPDVKPEETEKKKEKVSSKEQSKFIVPEGFKIGGDIVSENGMVEIAGEIDGSVQAQDIEVLKTGIVNAEVSGTGNVIISGKVLGGVSGTRGVEINSAQISGDINSAGAVKLDQGSSLNGNIYAKDAMISGEVIGNIECIGLFTCKRNGSVKGDITCAELVVEKGGFIEGAIHRA